MTSWAEIPLSGWGRLSAPETLAARPERAAGFDAAVDEALDAGEGLLMRGAGRSYGDQAVLKGGRAVLTERLDRVLAFDPETGAIETEAGCDFQRLIRAFAPKGWIPAAIPGAANVTMGGAVANDVHGKNHHADGSFGDHVEWIELIAPSGKPRILMADATGRAEKDLFRATIGGMGLTGAIRRVGFRMMRTPGASAVVKESRAPDLEAQLAALESSDARFSVSWIDAMGTGAHLGRGLVEEAELSGAPPRSLKKGKTRVPFNAPGALLSSLVVKIFNEVHYRLVPAGGRESLKALETFLFPLDAIADWNRLYGKRGFRQFQCVLPPDQAEAGLARLLERAAAAQAASPLGVLKRMGAAGRGRLSFPMEGYTLAMDFPNRPGVEELLVDLYAITEKHHGRIYLAKDSILSARELDRMYAEAGTFRNTIAKLDPHGRMRSDMSERLELSARHAAEGGK